MLKFTINKMIEVQIVVKADNAQDAFELMVDLNDCGPDFVLMDCQYTVYDENNNDITDTVDIP